MSLVRVLLWLLQIVLIAAFGSLQFVEKVDPNLPETFSKFFFSFVFDNRLLLSFVIGLSLAFITGWNDLYRPRKLAKEFRHSIMEAMLQELFNNDENNIRITIFKDASWFKKIKILVGLCLRFENPGYGDFVYVWDRLGTEHPNSKTFFYFNLQTQQGCEGIAGKVRQRKQEIISRKLPDLAGIDLYDKNAELNSKVVKYMKDGHIENIDTLRRLNVKSTFIYGNVLFSNKGEVKGVLVIDSFLKTSPFSDAVRQNLQYYIKMLSTAL